MNFFRVVLTIPDGEESSKIVIFVVQGTIRQAEWTGRAHLKQHRLEGTAKADFIDPQDLKVIDPETSTFCRIM